MREYLFRGRRIDNKEWIEGYLLVNGEHAFIAYYDNTRQYRPHKERVDPATVGQYTGLNGEDGKKIFEGDIVRLSDKHNELDWTAIVSFGNPNSQYHWGWQLKPITETNSNTDILLWVETEMNGVDCEIIGTINDEVSP